MNNNSPAKSLKWFIIFASSLVAFIVGVLINDIPTLTCDTKVRPFEVLNFLVILLFGYWFQNYQRKDSLRSTSLQKLLEQVCAELVFEINDISRRLEDVPANERVSDLSKNQIKLKFKTIAANVKFIIDAKPANGEVLNGVYLEFKDLIFEKLIMADFVADADFYKSINSTSVNLRNTARKIVYEI